MKRLMKIALTAILFVGASATVLASSVRTDYDHAANFSQYNSYSWGKVTASNPFYVTRIQQAVDQQLQAKGWKLMPSGGAVMIFATDNVHNNQQVQTMYDGFGGGWGGGWGWGGWGWRGGWGGPGLNDGIATTTTTNQPVGNLVVDMFEGSSKKILWRGLATMNLSTNEDKNTKELDGDVKNMFKNFPPKAGK